MLLQQISFENIMTKGKIAHTEQFFLLPQRFQTLFNNYNFPFRNFSIFLPISFQRRLLQIWRMWERVKLYYGPWGFPLYCLDTDCCRFKPFPSYRCFLTPVQQTDFWKHGDKRRNCSRRAISIFVTMFSIFSHRLSIQLKRFCIFWRNMFRVVCCRIGVWGKGLIVCVKGLLREITT